MIMYLNDGKVARVFGPHPERGKAIASTIVKRVTVGVRWSLPRKKYEPDTDVLVRPCVSLVCKGKGKWEVHVDPKYADIVQTYLIDHCR